MSMSTRISWQWVPEESEEKSNTLTLTTPNNHFVDIRILKDQYPFAKQEKYPFFDKAFQWAMCGIEHPIEGTSKIEFKCEVNSVDIIDSILNKKPLDDCIVPPDIGDFSEIEGSDDRRETGQLIHPDTGLSTDYVEIWRSLDPLKHSPTTEVREPKEANESLNYFVLETELSQFKGKLIRIGNWLQAVVYDKHNEHIPLNMTRNYFNSGKNTWESLIHFGDLEYPLDFNGSLNDTVTTSKITWKCIESS